MLVTRADRVQKLKTAGKSAQEAAGEKPLADLDAAWGKGCCRGSICAGGLFGVVIGLAKTGTGVPCPTFGPVCAGGLFGFLLAKTGTGVPCPTLVLLYV